MENRKYILAIDQGTSSTKTLIFDNEARVIAKGSENLMTDYLENGFVEQDPEEIFLNVMASVKKCLEQFTGKGHSLSEIASIGISNQRETFVLWGRDGNPVYPAIVWQCKRSVNICEQLNEQGLAGDIHHKTGLMTDPYFSATKLIWLFQNNPGIRDAIKAGNVFFGTIDTWLLFKLTNGKEYTTDYTNASRTMFFNLHTLEWDDQLIAEFGLTGICLPAIRPSASYFGETTINSLLPVPVQITSLVGDSHAAAFGEGCLEPGTAKATMGTGCSVMMNIGSQPLSSNNGMVTTVCWSMEGRVDYAYEGVIVSCGATIEWLKNELGLFSTSVETEAMANAVPDNGGVYLIPAFSGLGSPHWQMDRRASLSGINFSTNKNHIVRAALESIPFQIRDVIIAMEKDAGISLKELNTDGGITGNTFIMQFLSDLLDKPVTTIGMPDVSALGAALLAGLKAGIYKNIESVKEMMNDKRSYRPVETERALKIYREWERTLNSSL